MKTYTVTFDEDQYNEVKKVLEFIQMADEGENVNLDLIEGALEEMGDAHFNDSGE